MKGKGKGAVDKQLQQTETRKQKTVEVENLHYREMER